MRDRSNFALSRCKTCPSCYCRWRIDGLIYSLDRGYNEFRVVLYLARPIGLALAGVESIERHSAGAPLMAAEKDAHGQPVRGLRPGRWARSARSKESMRSGPKI